MQTLAPSWNIGTVTSVKWYVKLLPSLNDVAFLLPIFILFTRLNGTQTLFSDGDTGWHIRTGQWILAHRRVPTTDLFSFSKPDAPWFAWEWLWDVLAAAVHQFAGLAGIAFFTTIMLGIFGLLLYQLALRASKNHLISIAVTALALAVSTIHWLARPHLVTWLFAILFLHVLESARRKEQTDASLLLFAGLPALMLLWTNLHGGFVAGLVILFCYALGEMLTALFLTADQRPAAWLGLAWQSSSVYWRCLGLCALATLLNPYGWRLHQHLAGYLLNSELLDKIQEFQSISFHAGPAAFFEALLLLGAFTAFDHLCKRQITPALLICVWTHFALQSARHIPLFAIIATPFTAAFLAASLERIRASVLFRELVAAVTEISADFQVMERLPRFHLSSAAALLLMTGLFAVGQPPFAARFNPEAFPISAAVDVLAQRPGSRIFTTDQWGDYLLYCAYPRQRVFFDGRSDFYGADFVNLNQRIVSAEHGWRSLLEQFSINLVVLKPDLPLSAALKLTPGTRILFDDGQVIVFDIDRIYSSHDPRFSQVLRPGKVITRMARSPHVPQPVAIVAASPSTVSKNL